MPCRLLEFGKDIASDPSMQELLDLEYEQLLADRKLMREVVTREDLSDEARCSLPLNVQRIINCAPRTLPDRRRRGAVT